MTAPAAYDLSNRIGDTSYRNAVIKSAAQLVFKMNRLLPCRNCWLRGRPVGAKDRQELAATWNPQESLDQAQAVCVPNLPHFTRQVPEVPKISRYQLLQGLIKTTPDSIVIDREITNFSLLASKGFFSGPQVNPLGGTWLRCVSESGFCLSIPSGRLTEQDVRCRLCEVRDLVAPGQPRRTGRNPAGTGLNHV